MNWLGIQNEYNVGVLRAFYQSLSAHVKRREMGDKALVAHVRFTATVRGRNIEFDWKIINQLLGITDPILNKWKYHRRFPNDQLKDAYGTDGKKASGMSDLHRVIPYSYSRIMTHKGGNFSEFTLLDNPWLPRLLLKEPINPGQLISMELLRRVDGKTKKENVSLPFPQLIAFLLEHFNIKSTEGVDNRKCLPMDSKNLGKMGVSYYKPQGRLDPVHEVAVPLTTLSLPPLALAIRKWTPTDSLFQALFLVQMVLLLVSILLP